MVDYPTSLDAFTNPTATDQMDDVGLEHDVLHSDAFDAIEALEAKLGVDASSASSASVGDVLVADGVGGTTWQAQTDTDTTDHGALSGLGDDDHTQYLTTGRHDADDHSGLLPISHDTDVTGVSADDHHDRDHAARHGDGGADEVTITEAQISDLAHTTDHGALSGLGDDDHTQYLDTTRHDADDHSGLLPLDHGSDLTGLGGDDHTQYLNVARHDADDHSGLLPISHDADLTGVSADDHHTEDHAARHGSAGADSITITESQVSDLDHLTLEEVQDDLGAGFLVGGSNVSLTYDDGANTLTIDAVDTDTDDHGALTGLGDDDHTQYLNVARHDSDDHSGLLPLSHDTDLTGVSANDHHDEDHATRHGAGGGDAITITEAQISDLSHTTDHGALSGLGDDDHTQYVLVDGSRAMTGALQLIAGSDLAPSLNWSQSNDTGLFFAERLGSSEINLTAEGNHVAIFGDVSFRTFRDIDMGNNDLLLINQTRAADGSAASPTYTFENATGTGMWVDGVDLKLSRDGTEFLNVDQFAANFLTVLGIPDGSESFPGIAFDDDPDSGWYRISGGLYAFATNGDGVMRIGNNVVPDVDGGASLGISALKWSEVWADDGSINTSDARTKRDITDSDLGLDFLLDVGSKQWFRKGGTRPHHGPTAQDIKAAMDARGIDFAGFIDPSHRLPSEQDVPELYEDGEYVGEQPALGWRPTEFVGPIIKALEELHERLAAVEATR